eukprot:SAG11_NODE_2487_length_3302_cov_29.812051_1_plen_240_part_00
MGAATPDIHPRSAPGRTHPLLYSDELRAALARVSPLFDEPLLLEPGDGGWRRAAATKPAAGGSGTVPNAPRLLQRDGEADFCDVDVIDAAALTAATFHKRFRNRRPVLIKSTAGRPAWMTAGEAGVEGLFTRERLKAQFGPHPASVGVSLEIVSRMGSGYEDMNIGRFIDQAMRPTEGATGWRGDPPYLFQRDVLGSDIITPPNTGAPRPDPPRPTRRARPAAAQPRRGQSAPERAFAS